MGRILGPTGFLLTVAGDVAKGAIAVGVARALTGNDRVALLALLAVVAGHIWPVQLGCRGGKGVATSLAGLLAWDWQVALIFCVVYAAGCSLTRKSVASSLVAYAMLPAGVFWLGRSTPDLCGISILAGVVILAHYRNMAEGIHELMLHRRIAPETEQSVKDL